MNNVLKMAYAYQAMKKEEREVQVTADGIVYDKMTVTDHKGNKTIVRAMRVLTQHEAFKEV